MGFLTKYQNTPPPPQKKSERFLYNVVTITIIEPPSLLLSLSSPCKINRTRYARNHSISLLEVWRLHYWFVGMDLIESMSYWKIHLFLTQPWIDLQWRSPQSYPPFFARSGSVIMNTDKVLGNAKLWVWILIRGASIADAVLGSLFSTFFEFDDKFILLQDIIRDGMFLSGFFSC